MLCRLCSTSLSISPLRTLRMLQITEAILTRGSQQDNI